MKPGNMLKLTSILAAVLLLGCATGKPLTDKDPYSPQSADTGQYQLKVQNFQVIMDASSSMAHKYNGERKFWQEKRFLSALVRSVPEGNLNASLRTFGHSSSVSLKLTELRYGPVEFNAGAFIEALDKVTRPGGTSEIAEALDGSRGDLEGARGQIALILASDGKSTYGDPVRAADDLKDRFGDSICIYTVLVGDDKSGGALLREIADAGACGNMVTADDLTSGPALAGFVKSVFLKEKPAPVDSDGDGVPDSVDRCPGTPLGTRVDASGCPVDVDSDGDGVLDSVDKCPGTPMGTRVDASGCPVDVDSDGDGVLDSKDQCPNTPIGVKADARGCWVLEGVYFETGKFDVSARSFPVLDDLAAVLRKNPGLKVRIEGYTDNRGSRAYNQTLSENRARAVMDYLVSAGISSDRLSFVGYGPDRPAATNDTPEGRSKNRRVELSPML